MKFIKHLLALCVFAPSLAFADVSTIVEDGITVGVESTDSEGKGWSVRHLATQRGAELHGPVNLNGKWLYAIGGDVLTLSDDGRVVGRTTYPALIGGIRVEDNTLWLTLNTERHTGTLVAEVPHSETLQHPGAWSSYTLVALRTLSDVPPDIRKANRSPSPWRTIAPIKDDTSREDWERELTDLITIEETDLTNPMSSAYLGLAYQTLGQDALVGPAFDRAVARTKTWSDDLMVCGALERAGLIDAAKTACARAVDRMEEAGLRPKALWSLVLMVSTTQDLRVAMAQAVESKDYEAIDRIAGYFHAAFPNGEASAYVWDSLGTWLAAQGQDGLAKRWLDTAQVVEEDPLHQLFHGQTRHIDLALLLMASFGIAFVIAGFAIGVRSQRRSPGGTGWRRFIRPPTPLEAVSVLGLFFLTMWAGVEASRGVSQIGQVAAMPITVLSDTLGAPDAIMWLEKFDDSPTRTELLTYARHELESMKAGSAVTLEKPPSIRISELIREESESDAGFNPIALFELAGERDAGPGPIFFYFASLPGFLFFMIVGRIVSQLLGREKLIGVCALLPGSLSGALAPWTAVAVVSGFLYIASPVGSILHNISMPAFSKYFGLDGIGIVIQEKPDMALMVTVLVVGLIAHIISVILYAKSDQTADPGNTSGV